MLTVIYLLYNAEKSVPALVDSVVRQEGEFDVFFMDDCSRDGTLAALRRELAARGDPARFHVLPNPKNLGLAGTLNRALGLVTTPFALTCHCDAFFGRPDYVRQMQRLMEATPDAGSITGQPAIPPTRLPFAEKVNLVANLMDIFPEKAAGELVPVGFAEGRCDAFRLEALRAVGFYSTELRTSGEDQLLAARMREKGYRVYQAPALPYYLSVSEEQNTVGKLARHQRLFGRTHPYILLRAKGTSAGVASPAAGANRRARMLLRLTQLAFAFMYPVLLVGVVAGFWVGGLGALVAVGFGGVVVVGILAAKLALFGRHLRAVRLGPGELVAFAAWQPVLDTAYGLGFLEGLWILARGGDMRGKS